MRKLRNYCVCGSFMLLFIFIGLMLCNIPGFAAISALWEGMLDGFIIEKKDDLIMFCILAAFAFFCWLFIIVWNIDRFHFADARRFKRNIRRIKKNGKYQLLLDDFKNGKRIFSGELIVGDTFLIGRTHGMIVSYDDEGYIMRSSTSKRDVRTNDTQHDSNDLMYKNGKHNYLLCNLVNNQKQNQEWDDLKQMIEQKQCNLCASNQFLLYEIRYASKPPKPKNNDDD